MKFFFQSKASSSCKEIRELMEIREDFNSMRLPRSFANIQMQIFEDDQNNTDVANNGDNLTAGTPAALKR